MENVYLESAPTRAQVESSQGPLLLEFGANWCGHCRAAQPALAAAMAGHAGLAHHKIEDGPGRLLGRAFAVKLWPTMVFLRDGKEVARLVRPLKESDITAALAQIDPV